MEDRLAPVVAGVAGEAIAAALDAELARHPGRDREQAAERRLVPRLPLPGGRVERPCPPLSSTASYAKRETLPAKGALAAAMMIALTSVPITAFAFPPYRSTDAETADPWTVEARLGLVRVERDGDTNEYTSPLLRVNLGLPRNVELVSEFEYRPDEGQVGDAAIGFKWVPFMSALSLGVETLALLPVSQEGGAGVESLLLATWRHRALRVHVNAGGFYDERPDGGESGWKAGTIAELRLGRLRPGIEVFAKQEVGEAAQVLLGPGVIVDFGAFDLRAGLRVGLTDAAPDLVPNLWITTKLPLR